MMVPQPAQRGGHRNPPQRILPQRKARPVFLASQPRMVEYSNTTPPRSLTAPLELRNSFDAPRSNRLLATRGVLRTSTPLSRGRGRPRSLQNRIAFRQVSPVLPENSEQEEQDLEEDSSSSSSSETEEQDPLETSEEEEPLQEDPEDMEIDFQPEEDSQEEELEVQDEELEFLRNQYQAYLDALELLQSKYEDEAYKNPMGKSKLCKQAVSLHNNFAVVNQGLTHACQRLKICQSGEEVDQHAEIMAQLEQWIEEGQGQHHNTTDAVTMLQQSSLLNKTATDKGSVKMDTGKGVIELPDMEMPKGFFDPRITDKSTVSAVKKTLSEIELSEFDGTLKTTTWEYWWQTFYETIHRFPDTVIPECVRVKFLKKYIKGQAREAIRLDDPLTCNGVAVYSRIIRSLHQKYGRIQLTSNDANRKIVNLRMKDQTKTGISGFLTDLMNLTFVYVQTGVSIEAAFGAANNKLLSAISDDQRCRMLDAMQVKHSYPIDEYKKFLDYEGWINADLCTRIEKYSDKKGEKRRYEDQKESGSKKGYFKSSKKFKSEQSPSLTKVFHVNCKLHGNQGKPTHKAVDCRIPQDVKMKMCAERNLCYICQEEGHKAKKCAYKDIVKMATSGSQNKKNKPESKEGKGKRRKHKKEDTPQPSASKSAESPPVKQE